MAALDYAVSLGRGIVAITSDRSVDFHKGAIARGARFLLTASQRDWLSVHGVSSPNKIILPKQIHGDVIWKVTSKDAPLTGCYEADAVVTSEAGVPIAVRTADCLPLLLFDPVAKVIAAVHAGWKSTKLEIASKTVGVMKYSYGVNVADLRVMLGPCIRRDSYQVGMEFRSYFPEDVYETQRGLCFDLASANRRQLLASGLRMGNIVDCGRCTFAEADSFFSFRREATTAGRMINVIMIAS